MALIGVTGAHGSPGVTALAVALAHRLPEATGRTGLLLEADPDGGTIAARHELRGAPGLTALAGAARAGIVGADVIRFATPMASGLATIAGHPAAEQASAALRTAAANLAAALPQLVDHDVVVDLGRLRPGSPAQPLAAACDVLLLVCRPVVEQLVAIADRIGHLGSLAPLRLVLVGERPYSPAEVRRVLAVERISVIPDDRARVAADPAAMARGRRNPWTTALDRLVEQLVAQLEPEAAVDGDGPVEPPSEAPVEPVAVGGAR